MPKILSDLRRSAHRSSALRHHYHIFLPVSVPYHTKFVAGNVTVATLTQSRCHRRRFRLFRRQLCLQLVISSYTDEKAVRNASLLFGSARSFFLHFAKLLEKVSNFGQFFQISFYSNSLKCHCLRPHRNWAKEPPANQEVEKY